jgi:hypothetical protein
MKTFKVLIQWNFKETYCNKVGEVRAKSISEAYEKLKEIKFFNHIMKHNPSVTSKKGLYAIDRHSNLILTKK